MHASPPAGTVLDPHALANALCDLPVTIEDVHASVSLHSVADYYDAEPRPSGVVTLTGGDDHGQGECVAWYAPDQDAFARACPGLVDTGTTTVGEVRSVLAGRTDDPYHRAAVEAAALDLALRQARTSVFAVAGSVPLPVRFCWSINGAADPIEATGRILSRAPNARIKLDVDQTGWPDRVWAVLGALDRIVVIDFKFRTDTSQVSAASTHLPDAWIEDPPEAVSGDPAGAPYVARLVLDGPLLSVLDIDEAPFAPAALNVKAARMGGPIEALHALGVAREHGLHAYIGGMFEVGPGRTQARELASLYTADAWNDLAPLRRSPAAPYPTAPITVSGTSIGFGHGAT